jgi:hypothetical protein
MFCVHTKGVMRVVPLGDGSSSRLEVDVTVDGLNVGTLTVASGPTKHINAYQDGLITIDLMCRLIMGEKNPQEKIPDFKVSDPRDFVV